MEKIKAVAIALLLIGLVDTLYLTAEHFGGLPLVCPSNGLVNCATVLGSTYSTVFGVPLAVAGLIWVAVALLLFVGAKGKLLQILPIWYMLGAVGVAYSITAQYLLRHICIYCALLDTTIILFLAVVYIQSRRT